MEPMKVARRSVLKGLAALPVSTLIKGNPLRAEEAVHKEMTHSDAVESTAAYTPKFFNAHEYATLRLLCQTIIPSDEHWGGAIEGGAP